MSSTRSTIAPPPFAANALTVIPPTPVAGVSYRDPVAGPASSPDGWPYAERVNSAEWNQIMFQISTLVSIIDAKGILGWSSEKDYVEAAVAFGSNGVLYKWLQASGPNNGGAQDPTTAPLYWQTLASALNQAALPLGYFSGFTMANNASLPNTTIDVVAGSARNSINTLDINLTATLRGILQSSGAWAAGDNQNKLDTGVKTSNTWYRAFVIRKTSDGSADILFSLSLTSPALPSGYSGFRYIGPIKTDGSGNIIPFLMVGNGTRKSMHWKTPIVDVNAVNAGVTTPINYTLSVPSGTRVRAHINMNGFSGDFAASFRAPDFPGITPSYGNTAYFGGVALGTGTAPDYLAAEVNVLTDTLSRVAVTTLVASTSISIVTFGWEEEL